MNNFIFSALTIGLVLSACQKQNNGMAFHSAKAASLRTTSSSFVHTAAGEEYSRSIPIPVANRMIKSYRDAVNYEKNTEALRYWVFNADTLRNWLNSDKGVEIENLKIFPAHSLSYIFAGNEGKRPPVNSHALTLVIVGLDEENDYVYSNTEGAYNRCMPCPSECLNDDDPNDLLPEP